MDDRKRDDLKFVPFLQQDLFGAFLSLNEQLGRASSEKEKMALLAVLKSIRSYYQEIDPEITDVLDKLVGRAVLGC